MCSDGTIFKVSGGCIYYVLVAINLAIVAYNVSKPLTT